MAAVVGNDVTQIQDEDLLRRMWQDTEDFGRKKEIRARMYKLREQRLKEFYTTGEVLSDVLTTGSLESADSNTRTHSSSTISNKQSHQQVVQKSASYTSSSSGGNFAITHANSLADEGFMTLKSKEIRDSESPTRDFHRRQQTNQSKSISNSELQNFSSQDDGGNGYWKVVQESSSGDYRATGKMGDNGEMIVKSSTRTEQSKVAGSSDTDGLTCVSQVSASDDTSVIPPKERAAIKDIGSNDDTTSVVISSDVGGKSVTSSSTKSWSTSSKSQREAKVSSTSTSMSSVVHKDSGFSDDFQSKHAQDTEDVKDSASDQTERRSSSSRKTSQGKHRITQRSSTTDMPVGELCIARDADIPTGANADTIVVKTTQVGDKIITDIKMSGSTEAKSTNITEKRVITEQHGSGSHVSTTQKTVVTSSDSPGDAGNWTVVSSQTPGKRDGVDGTTEEFVFRSGHDDSQERNTRISTSFVSKEDASIVTSKDTVDRVCQENSRDDITTRKRDSSPEKKPSVTGVPTEQVKKGIMKQPSQEKIVSPDQYVTTYQQHFTTKRISVDNDPNHDAFARSLRSSPERGTPTSTRSSSKVSLDRASPTRNYRNKTSTDSSLASLNRTSPSRTSPSRSSPERGVNRAASPTKSTRKTSSTDTPHKSGPRSSPSRRSPEKTTEQGSPTKGPNGSPERSPTRSTSPSKTVRRPSYTISSPDKGNKNEPEQSRTPSSDRVITKSPQTKGSPDNVSNRSSPVKGLKEQTPRSPTRETSPSKIARRSSSARNSPEKETFGSPRKSNDNEDLTPDKLSKAISRRVSAGDRPKTDMTPKTSVTSVIKEKRRLSSGVAKDTTKKKCSTPGISPSTSPTYPERQSRPRSRGSSRASSDSDGSDNDTTTLTRKTEENTRRYQQEVTNKEEELMSLKTTSNIKNEININESDSTLLLLKHEHTPSINEKESPPEPERSPKRNVSSMVDQLDKSRIQRDSLDITIKTTKTDQISVDDITITDVIEDDDDVTVVSRPAGSPPLKGQSRPCESPVSRPPFSKLPRERSPEYSSEGSLANELPRRPTGSTSSLSRDAASPVKQLRDVQERRDSPDSSPERASFAPIKCFRTSPEERPTMLELTGTQGPKSTLSKPSLKSTSPDKPMSAPNTYTDSSDDVDDKYTAISKKEPVKPGKPITTRPESARQSPERPNSSPVTPGVAKLSPSKVSPTRPSPGSDHVPELTRRSPTPDSLRRRENRESNSSSVSPCSSPERHSDRESMRSGQSVKKNSLKKTVGTEKSPRDYSPEKASPNRGEPKRRPDSVSKSPQKSVLKKNPDNAQIRKVPREANSQPERKSNPENESPERCTTCPSHVPGNKSDKVPSQSKSPRPSSIPRPGQKTPDSPQKPFGRQPSWSKTLRGSDMAKESPRSMTPKSSPGYDNAPSNRKPQSPSSSPDRKRPTSVNARPQAGQSPLRSHPSPSSSPERQFQSKPQKKKTPTASPIDAKSRPCDISPARSAFARTNSKPDSTKRAPDVLKKPEPVSGVSKFTVTSKISLKSNQPKVDIEDGQSTDRSSTVSSPETVMPARDTTKKKTEVFMPQLSSNNFEDTPVSLPQVTNEFQTGDIIEIKITKATRQTKGDYDEFSDECGNLMDETPPEEFLVDDDEPAESKHRQSSIPKRSNNTVNSFKTTITKKVSDNSVQVKKRTQPSPITKPSTGRTPAKPTDVRRPIVNQNLPNSSRMPQKIKPEPAKTFKTAVTIDTRTTRTSEQNVRRTVPTSNGVQNKRPVPKSETHISQLSVKNTNAKTRSSVQQKVNTVTSVVNTRLSSTTKTIQSPTTRKTVPQRVQPKGKVVVEKPTPKGDISKTAKPLKPGVRQPGKRMNGVSKVPEYSSSSSEDEEGLPDECPSLVDTDDDYIREMEELRQDEESNYAMKVTSREDALLSVCQDKLKTTRDSLTIAGIRLKSSRESSPDCRGPRSVGDDVLDLRPRYADRVSEPEDEEDHFRKPDAVRFQRPVLHPNPLDESMEECANTPTSTKLVPKVYPKSILVDSKPSTELTTKLMSATFLKQDEASIGRLLQEIDRGTPKKPSDYISLSYPQGKPGSTEPSEYPIQPQEDMDDEKPKKPSEYLQKVPSGNRSEPTKDTLGYPLASQSEDEPDDERQKRPKEYPQQRPVQVTDLDASDTEESTRLLVSVSDRVSHFLETAKSQSSPPAPQSAAEPVVPSSLDSPSAVKKARAMFETIATQKTSPPSPRQMDILSRPSVFEGRRKENTVQEKSQLFQGKTTERPKENEPRRSDSFTRPTPQNSYVNEYPSDDDNLPSNHIATDSPMQFSSPEDAGPKTSPKETYARNKSPTGKISTDTYPRKKSSPERHDLQSPTIARTVVDIDSTTVSRNRVDTNTVVKTSTDTFVRKKATSPERSKNDSPRDSYRKDKIPPGKINTDTFTRPKPSSSPERPKYETAKDKPSRVSTDTFTRRKSPERPGDYGTYTKPKPTVDKQPTSNKQNTVDKYASFPSQTRVSKMPEETRPESSPKKSYRPFSPTKTPSDDDHSPVRKESVPSRTSACSPVRRDSLPKKDYPVESSYPKTKPTTNGHVEDRVPSPTRKPSIPKQPRDESPKRTSPSRQLKESPKMNGTRSSPEREFPRKTSLTGKPSSPSTGRLPSTEFGPSSTPKDSLPKDSKRIVYLEESSSKRGSAVFGVALRSTASTTTTTATMQRRRSGDATPKAVPVEEDENIEEIFDVDLLESMLEKATGYDKRRRLRAQIRVVRRQMEESSSTITTTVVTSSVTVNDALQSSTPAKMRPDDAGTTPSKPFQGRSPETKPFSAKSEPSRPSDARRTSSPDRKPQGRRPSDSVDFQTTRASSPDRKPQGRRPSDTVDFQTTRSPSPDRKPQGRRPSDTVESQTIRASSPDRKPQGRRPSDTVDFQTPRASSPDRKPQGRRPSDSVDFTTTRASSPDRKPQGRRPSDSVDFQTTRASSPDRKPQGRRPSDTVDFQTTRSPSPDRKPQGRRPSDTVDRSPSTRREESSTFAKRNSKTELTIELKSPATTPVKPPAKKWSVGEKPQEVCPVTSSYGVGPTDENGRPLFGLRALRKSHNSQSSIDIDLQPSAPKPDESPQEVSDRGGRPLFGGLRALKVASTTSSVVSSSTNRTTTRRDSGSVVSREEEDQRLVGTDDEMPEQPESPQLKDLVSRHEQQFRGSSASQPLQKPRAKLRDSFVLQTSSSAESKKVEDATKALSLRGQSLRSLIQKHESITKDDETSLVGLPRSGFLKTGRDGVITEGSSVSTVVTSRGTLRSDGTVSLSRDIITGETVLRPGEEPVTKVTRTQQRYNTPKDNTPAIQDVDDQEDVPSNRKLSSPDRFTSSASVTSNSSLRRLEDDVTSSRSQRKVDDSKFTNSSILTRSKFIDEVRSNRKTSPTRASPEKDGRFTSSTSTVLTRRPSDSSPTSSTKHTSSVRRQIFNDNEDSNKLSNISTRQGKYSTSTVVTSTSQVSSVEQKYSTGGVDNRRTSQGYIVDYNDDDESDGYQHSSRYIEECSNSSSPRASPDKVIAGLKKTDSKVFTSRRSSTPGEEGEKTPTGTKRGVTRGNSVRALQEKFQQAAAEANNPESSRSQRNYPKAGLIFRSASFRLNNGNSSEPGSPVGSSPSSNQSTPQADCANRSFLDNQTRVTGVQDILTRMRNADHVVESGDTVEDSEARALLNKFLGAQMILQGMEPLVQASQSAALVSQVERQRVLTSTSSSNKIQTSAVVNRREQDIEEIWDESKLRKLLDNCTDYEARRKIRARLRIVMAEQKACSDIVTAALADEAAADKNNQNVELRSEQGESLLLPLLVQQLRYRSNSNQTSEMGVEDSGTESGEDLKLLAVGLRDSIELQRQSQTSASEALGPTLLAEVQTALSRLEASLTLGDSELDSNRKDALLQLVARLQSSLRLPAPPWSKVEPKQTDKPQNQRRFSNRKTRQNRHTVGVSREELADARRLMEETSIRDKISSDVVKQESAATQVKEPLPVSVAPTKQNSEGDLFSTLTEKSTPVTTSSAFQAYRPVNFAPPRRSSSGSTTVKNLVPFPFEVPQFDGPLNQIQPSMHKPLTQTMSLDSGTNKEYTNNAISNDQSGLTKNNGYTYMPRPSDIISQKVSDRMCSESDSLCHDAVQSLPCESQSFQQPPVPQRSGSGSSVAGKAQHVSYSRSSSNNSKEAALLDSRRSTSLSSSQDSKSNSKESTALRLEKPVVSTIKPKRPPFNSNNTSNESLLQNNSEQSLSKLMSQSSGSFDSQTDSKESIPQQLEKESVQQRILNQSISLDNSNTIEKSGQIAGHPNISHSCSLDSARSDYDPSVLLFTPAESVQIAVHKAAINKQISIETEKRSKNNRKASESEVESSDEMVSSDDSGESDSEQDDEEEEEEESSTLRQGNPTKPFSNVSKSGTSKEAPVVPDVKKMLARTITDRMAGNKYVPPSNDANMQVNGANSVKYPQTHPSKGATELVGSDLSKVANQQPANEVQHAYNTGDKHKSGSLNGRIETVKVVDQEKVSVQKTAPLNQEPVNKMIWNEKQTAPVSQESGHKMIWDGLNKQTVLVGQDSANKKMWNGVNDKQALLVSQEPVNKLIWNGLNDKHVVPVSQGPSNKVIWNGINDKQPKNSTTEKVNDPREKPQAGNIVDVKIGGNVSSAQRLLQMATEDPTKTRYQSRKLKMKRANTIDIPKPLNFYQVEADSDGSSDDEANDPNGTSSEHRAAYLALRGPIRVGNGWPVESKAPPPSLKPKTESDHKFLALLNRGGAVSADEGSKTISYNPSARGGQPWSNRFSNIKTAFESGNCESKPVRARSNSGPANARMFWQTADDSVTMLKSSTPSSNGPRLSRQGSIFLHKLHEQKEQEKQAKLPWTDKKTGVEPSKLPWNDKYVKESVVVGSLTVAAKGNTGTVQSKKQIFTPPASPVVINRPLNINKFSHAPMSAFRPIEKKPTTISKTSAPPSLNVEPLPNQPWGSSSASGNVKQLASQKFCAPPQLDNSNTVKATPQQKQTKLGEFRPKHELISPVSPTLPWIQKNGSDHSGLLSAVDKFENFSRESSPQPHVVPHLHKVAPTPPPRAFLGVPKQPPPVPSPPNLIQNYSTTQNLNHQNQLNFSDSTQNHNQTKGVKKGNYSQVYESKVDSNSFVPLEEDSQHSSSFAQSSSQMQLLEPLQTYSGCVTSRSSVYPNTGFQYKIPPQAKPELSPRPDVPLQEFQTMSSSQSVDDLDSPPNFSDDRLTTLPQQPISAQSAIPAKNLTPPKPLQPLKLTPSELLKSPQFQSKTLNSPEEMQAVSRVMTGPVCHQAETVSNKTKHCGDDEPVSRTTAALSLSSLLNKFSSDDDLLKKSPQRSPINFKPDLDNSASALPKYQSLSSQRSPTFEGRQDYEIGNEKFLAHQPSSRFHRSPTSGIMRNRSEPNIAAMMDEEQFLESQHKLLPHPSMERTNYVANNYARSGSPKLNPSLQRQDVNMFSNSNYGQYQSSTPSQRGPYALSTRVRPASTESLITATSTEEFQDSGESVLTTRLQIPVYSNNIQNSGTRVKEGSHLLSVSPRSNSFNERKSPSVSPSILQKSESWHQLAAQQMRGNRPQSMALPDLPIVAGNTARKIQAALPRAKSSHSLAAAKQFEAAVLPDAIRDKQRAVEAYLNKPSSKPSPPSQPRITHGPSPVKSSIRKQMSSSSSKRVSQTSTLTADALLLDDSLDNVDEAFETLFNAAVGSSKAKTNLAPLARFSESSTKSSSVEGNVTTKTEVTTRTSSFSSTAVGSTRVVSKAPSGKVVSPFSKFQQMDRQNSQSAPNSPKTPGGSAAGPLFTFTDPKLCRSASGVKDRLLFWCQVKTKEYKNIQIENFSTSWSNGLAFCALVHHFLPDAFDYDALKPEERRKNFDLAFRIADEKADIAPLLDVEDMVMMRKPDWKCVFTYVQSIYRRFKDQD